MEYLEPLTLALAALAAVWARASKREATAANDAVNHRHASGTPRIYDLIIELDKRVDELIEWKRGYDGGPMDSGQKVLDFMKEFRERCADCPSLKKADDEQDE